MRRLDTKRHDPNNLAIDITKVVVLAGWIWLFSLWLESGGSPRRMVESLEASRRDTPTETLHTLLAAKAASLPGHRRQQ